jgi:hypothetical protein
MRREFSNKVRLEIVRRATNEREQVVCEGCGLVLASKKYDLDHIIPEAMIVDKSKPLTAQDGQLLGVECCHRGGRNKTVNDIRKIAKAKRLEARRLGLRKPSQWSKKWRKKVNGTTVLRNP